MGPCAAPTLADSANSDDPFYVWPVTDLTPQTAPPQKASTLLGQPLIHGQIRLHFSSDLMASYRLCV